VSSVNCVVEAVPRNDVEVPDTRYTLYSDASGTATGSQTRRTAFVSLYIRSHSGAGGTVESFDVADPLVDVLRLPFSSKEVIVYVYICPAVSTVSTYSFV